MKKTLLIVTLAAPLLCACYQDIDLETYRGESRLVMNAIANGDTTVMASISRTWFFADDRPAAEVPEQQIDIFVNGTFRESMRFDGEKYQSDVRPQPGDTLLLRTQIDGQELSAQEVMPERTPINRITTSCRAVYTWTSGEEYTYHISLPNTPGKKRFYFLRTDTEQYVNRGDVDYSYDPAFQLTSERINRDVATQEIEGQFGLPFSNETCSGDEFVVTFKETVYPEDNVLPMLRQDAGLFYKRTVTVYTISESYYRYLVTMMANDADYSWQGKLLDVGLAEQTRIYSNVQGGTGIFGCVQRDSMEIFLSQ